MTVTMLWIPLVVLLFIWYLTFSANRLDRYIIELKLLGQILMPFCNAAQLLRLILLICQPSIQRQISC